MKSSLSRSQGKLSYKRCNDYDAINIPQCDGNYSFDSGSDDDCEVVDPSGSKSLVPCTDCDKVFQSESALNRHCIAKHSLVYPSTTQSVNVVNNVAAYLPGSPTSDLTKSTNVSDTARHASFHLNQEKDTASLVNDADLDDFEINKIKLL